MMNNDRRKHSEAAREQLRVSAVMDRLYFFIILCMFFNASCKFDIKNLNKMNLEYEQITNSGKSGRELYEALSVFERNNMARFNSKIDLGGVNLLTGGYTLAKDYFLRAEAVLSNAGNDEASQKNIVILYGSLARISLIEGGYIDALEYVDKAVYADKWNDAQYQFLKAHILTALNRNEEALLIFDRFYPENTEAMTALDLRAYMYLLAGNDRTRETALALDQYLAKGSFFPGLGVFASTVYEKNNEIKKSILSAFLDYEYYASYKESKPADFLKNLDTLEKRLLTENKITGGRYALNLLRGLYTASIAAPSAETRDQGFFIEDYVIIRSRIQKRAVDAGDFNRFILLEPFFSQFPVYYWNVWQAVLRLDPDSRVNFVRVLEKIIALDKTGVYAKRAWDETAKLMGYAPQ
jgi:tetratricopeptide (TPR) repeat protein